MPPAIGSQSQCAEQHIRQSQSNSKLDVGFDYPTEVSGSRSRENEDLSPDGFTWWQATGELLLALFAGAGYTVPQQEAMAEFYKKYVTTNLGPIPTAAGCSPLWKSFMTDDFTPIEFSWAWGDAETVPEQRIRLSFEPIGSKTGSKGDPWNTDAAKCLMHKLTNGFDDVEAAWFNRLVGKMSAGTGEGATLPLTGDQFSPSSSFLAFEFGNSEPVVKAYLLPAGRSGTSAISAVLDTMKSFAEESSWGQLSELVAFLENEGKQMQLRPCMVAIDCVSQNPRVKIYVRCPNTSFQHVKQVLSVLGASRPSSTGFAELQNLWQRVFSLEDGFDQQSWLHCDVQKTPGMLYYFGIRPGSPKVISKVYLPVKYFGKDDESIALGLTSFFRSTNRIQSRVTEQYLHTLRVVCPYRKLSDGTGIHTYITATIKNDSIDVISYLSPEVYREGRFKMRDRGPTLIQTGRESSSNRSQ